VTPGKERILFGVTYRVGGSAGLGMVAYIASLSLLGIYFVRVGRYPLYDWLAVVSAAAVFGSSLSRRKLRRYDKYILIAGGMFILAGIVTSLFSQRLALESQLSSIILIYVILVWIPLATIVLRSWERIRIAYVALTISMVITSMYAVGQKYFGWPFFGERIEFWGRMTGLTRHPNELGTFCAMVLPYCICIVDTERNRILRMGWIASLVAGAAGIVYSGSMTGAVMAIVGATYYYLVTRRRRRRQIVNIARLASVFLVVGFVLVSQGDTGTGSQTVVQRIEDFGEGDQGRITLALRLSADDYAWRKILESPLAGYGYHARAENVGTLIHNGFLRAWYGGGIFALLGVVVIEAGAFLAFIRFRRIMRHYQIGNHVNMAGAAGAAFLAFLIMTLTSPTLEQRSGWFPVAIIFAVAAIVRRATNARTSHEANVAMT
jgi:hypothetical protein